MGLQVDTYMLEVLISSYYVFLQERTSSPQFYQVVCNMFPQKSTFVFYLFFTLPVIIEKFPKSQCIIHFNFIIINVLENYYPMSFF